MRILSMLSEWNGTPPAYFVMADTGVLLRYHFLKRLTAKAMQLSLQEIEIQRMEGEAPFILRPENSGYCLSSARRAGLFLAGISEHAIGVDIEKIMPGTEPPWNVLHPQECAFLRACSPPDQPRVFAQIWTLKEAYLKALGIGLSREPASFAALPYPDNPVLVDEEFGHTIVTIASHVQNVGEQEMAFAMVILQTYP
jgi:4'-phosphopantetheinyl transferase